MLINNVNQTKQKNRFLLLTKQLINSSSWHWIDFEMISDFDFADPYMLNPPVAMSTAVDYEEDDNWGTGKAVLEIDFKRKAKDLLSWMSF